MNNIINELKNNIKTTIDNFEIFNYPKAKIIHWFIKWFEEYSKIENNIWSQRSFKWSIVFYGYEYFLAIILSKDEKEFWKKQWNIEYDFFDFCLNLYKYNVLFDKLNDSSSGIYHINQIWDNIIFFLDKSSIDEKKYYYLTVSSVDKDNNIDYNDISEKVKIASNKFMLENFWFHDNNTNIIYYYFEEMFEIKDNKILNTRFKKYNNITLLDVKNALFNLYFHASQEVEMNKHWVNHDINIISRKDLEIIISLNFLNKNVNFTKQQINNLIELLSIDIKRKNEIKDIDLKCKILFKNNDIFYISPSFIQLIDINRAFYSITKDDCEKVFLDYKTNSFLKDVINKFKDKFQDSWRLIFQKKYDMVPHWFKWDIDYSIFDKVSWTLIMFEGKNFISAHTHYDNIKIEFLKKWPLNYAYETQYKKLKSFIENDFNEKLLINMYWEKIDIKRVFYYTITWNIHIWIKKYVEDDYKVINFINTLKIIDKSSIDEIFSSINTLADYDFYLNNVSNNIKYSNYKLDILINDNSKDTVKTFNFDALELS